MRAIRIGGEGVEVVDVPAPTGEGIRVRIRSAGICGSDLHMVSAGFPIPNTLGHEFAGELDDGTPVAVEPLAPCGTCDRCLESRYNLCRMGPSTVIGVMQDGGMADEVRVPERSIVPLAPGVDVADASLVEPLAVAIHGVREAGIEAGQRVAVIGGGTIGLCAVAAARWLGADASLKARHPHQVEAGDRLGAREVQGEYDVVIDCAGTTEAIQQGVELCSPGAQLVLLASYWGGLTLPAFAVCLKEIRLIPSSMYSHKHATRDFEEAADLLAEHAEVADVLITHRLPLDEAPRAFEIAADRKAGAIKVVLEA
jgi:threonine dehydrogenase-like Zn-dependent dehydrogenase